MLTSLAIHAALLLLPTALSGVDSAPMPAIAADTATDRVGVNVHVMHGDTPYHDLPAVQRALRYLGVSNVRDGIRWYGKGPAAWYDVELRRRLTILGRSGVRMQLILPGPGDRYGSINDALNVAAGVPGVAAIEGVNEWDLKGPGGSWVDGVREQTRSVKAAMDRVPALRETPFVAPSFGRAGRGSQVGDLSPFVDFGNGHPYANGARPELPEDANAVSLDEAGNDAAAVAGGKPQMFTEFGFHNALQATSGQRGVDEKTAGIYLVRSILEYLRRDVAGMFMYELVDSFEDEGNTQPNSNWGLFTTDWKPKASARAVRSLMAALRDAGPSPRGRSLGMELDGGDENVRSLLLAKSNGRFTLALWRAEPIWDHAARAAIAVPPINVGVRLTQRASFGTTRLRRLGQPAQLATIGRWKQLSAQVGAEPTFLTFRATTD